MEDLHEPPYRRDSGLQPARPDLPLVALPFKLLGVRYIFDHHDINPELYEAKFNKRKFFWQLMVLFEKLTFKAADVSIATNHSYRQVAIGRGGIPRCSPPTRRRSPSKAVSHGNIAASLTRF